MKLLKKLLPIATIASVGAVVAPIATSCSGANSGFTEIDVSDILKLNYQRRSAVKDITILKDADTLFETYLDDVNKNKDILTDDLFEFIEYRLANAGYPSVDEKKYKLDGTVGIKTYGANSKEHRLSFGFVADLHFVYHYVSDSAAAIKIDIPADIKLDLKLTDLKFRMGQEDSRWRFTPDYVVRTGSKYPTIDFWALTNDKKWSVDLYLSLVSPLFENVDLGAEISGLYNAEALLIEENKAIILELTEFIAGAFNATNLGFTSNYLTNVRIGKKG